MASSSVPPVPNPRFFRLIVWLPGLLLASAAWAQPMRDLVQAALDEKVTSRIEIAERPIRDALRELEKATGLSFALHEKAIEWMPYGEQTRISIVIQDMSVGAALTRIFDGLGLTMRVHDDKVMVDPAPVLDRLGRRLTIDEVRLLEKLAVGPWSALKPEDFALEFRLPPKDEPHKLFEQAMKEGPAASAFRKLEDTTQRLGWLWIPQGQTIIVYSRSEDVQQRLDRPLDLSYRRIALDDLLLDLAKRIGATLHFEPGVLQRVRARERHVDLIQRGMTVRQVLELLVGNAGIVYEVVEDGIVIGAPQAATGGGAESGDDRKSRVVAILRVPVGTDGTTIDFLIRADELPEEFQKFRDRKLPEVIETLRKKLDN